MNAIETLDVKPLKSLSPTSSSWYRKMVVNQMGSLRGGTLTLTDQFGRTVLGQPKVEDLTVFIEVHDQTFYKDLFWGGNLAVAETYLQGKWDCDNLTDLIRLFCRNLGHTSKMNKGLARISTTIAGWAHKLACNSISGSKKNIVAHYDLSNDFFEIFLDRSMMYSSAYYCESQDSLEQASTQKLELICQQLKLKPHDHVLEIGTGWGGFAIHAAKNYGCRVTTTTISENQYAYTNSRIQDSGLVDKITLLKEDYRNLHGQYDKIVSIEMIEAVGHDYLQTYFEKCHALLKPGGVFLVQAITIPQHRYEAYRRSVDFIQKYIFPGGHLPSISSMLEASKRTDLLLIASGDFGESYALTLREWRRRFFDQIAAVRQLGFDDRFIRMWEYYLCYCEGAFLEQAVGVSHLLWKRPSF